MTATTIKLTGNMGKRFGREYKLCLDTKTPAEAVRALCCMVKGFREYLMNAKDRGIEFAVWRGAGQTAENIGVEQLKEPAGDVIRIAPIVAGSKSGILQTILGVALIAVATVATGGLGAAFSATGIWGAVVSTGVAMAAGGVLQMLSPQPKLTKAADSADNQGSYIFSGAVNTTAQGNPVPVLYGRMIVGSAVISAGISDEDYTPATNGVGVGTPTGSSAASPYVTNV